jgi:hypothetical protein
MTLRKQRLGKGIFYAYEFGSVDPVEKTLVYLIAKQAIFFVELRKPTTTSVNATCLMTESVQYLCFQRH